MISVRGTLAPIIPVKNRRPEPVLFATAVAAALLIGAGRPLYWDTFGYLMQAINGDVGGLMLGRPVFVYTSYLLAHAFIALGGSVWTVEPLLRAFWMALSCASAPLTYQLARSVGLTSRAAAIAGTTVAVSPALAHTSNAVLTDGPALALTLLSFVLASRAVEPGTAARRATGLAAAAGAVMGLACGVRETAVLNVVSLGLIVLLAPRPARTVLLLVAGSAVVLAGTVPVLWAYAHQSGYLEMIQAWRSSMAAHRLEKTYGVRDLGFAMVWTLALGPLAFVAAFVAWCREPRRLFCTPGTMAFVIVAPSIAQLIFFGGYLDISYSPRYLLAALPGALAIPAAMTFDRFAVTRRQAIVAVLALAVPLIVATPIVRTRQRGVLEGLQMLRPMTSTLSDHTLIVTGQMCPGIAWLKTQITFETGRTPGWETMCPGWAWPQDLPSRLGRAIQEQRALVFDLRPSSWIGAEQRAALAGVEQYLATHPVAALTWR